MIYEKYPELKYKYRNQEYWCLEYYVDTAGKNAQKMQEYIKRQLMKTRLGNNCRWVTSKSAYGRQVTISRNWQTVPT